VSRTRPENSLVPIEKLKTHKSGRFDITEKMILEVGNLKELEKQFNQVVFANPEYIFFSHWEMDGTYVIEWQWMPWKETDEQHSTVSAEHDSSK
jgi:hypothetical protein